MLVHCVGAYSRTPTVGALYGARLRDISGDEALRDVIAGAPRRQPQSRVPRKRCGASGLNQTAQVPPS